MPPWQPLFATLLLAPEGVHPERFPASKPSLTSPPLLLPELVPVEPVLLAVLPLVLVEVELALVALVDPELLEVELLVELVDTLGLVAMQEPREFDHSFWTV